MGAIAAGVGTIYSGVVGGAQESSAAQAEWQANNALAQYGYRQAEMKGQQQVGEIRSAGSALRDQQYVGYANSGVDATTGTAAAVQADSAAQTELDAQTAKNNAAREAWGFKVQQESAHRAYQTRINAAQNRVIGSILTGAGQIASGGMSIGGGGDSNSYAGRGSASDLTFGTGDK